MVRQSAVGTFSLLVVAEVWAQAGTGPGSLDASFRSPKMDGEVKAILVQPDGEILIGGSFLNVDGQSRAGVARLARDGSLDADFKPGLGIGGTNYVSAFALQSDGRILIGGEFRSFDGVPCGSMARLNSDGSIDPSFLVSSGIGDFVPRPGTSSQGMNWHVSSLALEPNGTILVGGYFLEFNGAKRRGIARLRSNGGLDAAFNPSLYRTTALFGNNDPEVCQVGLDASGRTLVGGNYFLTYMGSQPQAINRFNSDGTPDSTFFPGFVGPPTPPPGVDYGLATVRAFGVQSDGRIVLAGNIAFNREFIGPPVVRLLTDGSVDASFFQPRESSRTAVINALVIQPDDRIIVAGYFGRLHDSPCTNLARLKPQGLLDQGFLPEIDSEGPIRALALQSKGDILIGGTFKSAGSRTGIVRLKGDQTGVEVEPPAIVVQPADQRVVLGARGAFNVGASGLGLSYQWQFARQDIPGATNGVYVIPSVSTNQAGVYRVVITNSKGSVISTEARLLLLDLAEALDTPGWVWTTGSFLRDQPDSRLWFGQLDMTSDGEDAAAAQYVSGPAPYNVAVWLETRLEGPGRLTFQWKADPAPNGVFAGGATFLVNGARRPAAQGPDRTWKQETYEIPPGPAALRWESYGYYGPVYLDRVTFSPVPHFRVETATSAGGRFQIYVETLPGYTYRFEYSDNLVTWSPLTNISSASSLIRLTDPIAQNSGQRFYRGVQERLP